LQEGTLTVASPLIGTYSDMLTLEAGPAGLNKLIEVQKSVMSIPVMGRLAGGSFPNKVGSRSDAKKKQAINKPAFF